MCFTSAIRTCETLGQLRLPDLPSVGLWQRIDKPEVLRDHEFLESLLAFALKLPLANNLALLENGIVEREFRRVALGRNNWCARRAIVIAKTAAS